MAQVIEVTDCGTHLLATTKPMMMPPAWGTLSDRVGGGWHRGVYVVVSEQSIGLTAFGLRAAYYAARTASATYINAGGEVDSLAAWAAAYHAERTRKSLVDSAKEMSCWAREGRLGYLAQRAGGLKKRDLLDCAGSRSKPHLWVVDSSLGVVERSVDTLKISCKAVVESHGTALVMLPIPMAELKSSPVRDLKVFKRSIQGTGYADYIIVLRSRPDSMTADTIR